MRLLAARSKAEGAAVKKERAGDVALEVSRKAALGMAAAALTAYVLGNAIAGAGVGAAVITLGEKIAAWERERRQRAIETWWRALLDDETRSPESVAEMVTQKMNDPRVADEVMRSIRAAVDATDPAVIPALARLEKRRVMGSQAPGPFFRGMARMLCDIDETELGVLRTILLAFVRTSCPAEFSVHVNAFAPRRKGLWLIEGDGAEDPIELRSTPLRIFRLLKRHDLAHDCDDEVARDAIDGTPNHTRHVLFERAVAGEMLVVIGPQPEA